MIYLYNSLTRKKESFLPNNPEEVLMYVCGITPYDTTHLGHAFTYISFDVLVRLLKYKGYRVIYTQNVTDINDRDKDILQRAKEQNIAWQDLAKFWTKKFLDDMRTLNWIMPGNFIKASENLQPMIEFIEKLLKNGYAYEKHGSVYFDVSKKNDFGKLSGLDKIRMLKISKDFDEDVDNPEKDDPLDFTLWRAKSKNEPPYIPTFESPYGLGRPGWHIECSSMATLTRDQIDIHGGGIDLIYPHHEAEIAQSEGATSKVPFAKFWLHTSPVSHEGEKMSKSLGNLVMVSDLLKKYSPNVIRWYLISHHYRNPWEFSDEDLDKSKTDFFEVSEYINSQKQNAVSNENIPKEFVDALEDDLNTPVALQILQKIVRNKGSAVTLSNCLSLLGFLI